MEDFTFAENLRNIRKSMGLTQAELAKKLSVSKQAVVKWENGILPTGDNLLEIHKVLGISLDEMFDIKEKDIKLRVNDETDPFEIISEVEMVLGVLKKSIKNKK